MKQKKLMLLLFIPLVLSGCNNITTQDNTKTKLTLQPNEQYLVNDNIPEPEKSGLFLRKDAPAKIDYQFSISKTEVDELSLINPNDLIVGRERILLQPVAVNYAVKDGIITNEEVSRLTPEQTESNFVPIIEMSGSGYGNDDISLDIYDTPQLRTCFAITNTEGALQSEYYDISVVIEDSVAPSADTDVLNLYPYISYKNEAGRDGSILDEDILRNYTDNDEKTTLSVKYFTDNTYTTETTAAEVIKTLRNNEELITNNEIKALPTYYKVYDDNGNASNNGLAYVTLCDDVKPYLVNKDGVEVNAFDFGTRNYHPYVNDEFKKYIKDNFKLMDEVDGELSLDGAIFNISTEGAMLEAQDESNNILNIFDTKSKLNNSELEWGDYYVWYPNGASEDVNPERGLKYKFILNEETNEYEIEILGPNLAKGQYRKDWKGTDGAGHIQIPQTIKLYDTEYKVTVIGEYAFNMVPYKSINEKTIGLDKVVDFSNTYIRFIENFSFVTEQKELCEFFILNSLNDYIDVGSISLGAANNISKAFISNKVKTMNSGAISLKNIYMNMTEDERYEREESGEFMYIVDDNGYILNSWFNRDVSVNFHYDYTLEQFKTEFGIL